MFAQSYRNFRLDSDAYYPNYYKPNSHYIINVIYYKPLHWKQHNYSIIINATSRTVDHRQYMEICMCGGRDLEHRSNFGTDWSVLNRNYKHIQINTLRWRIFITYTLRWTIYCGILLPERVLISKTLNK